MKISEIGYLTEDPGKEYAHGLDHAATRDELIAYLETWDGLAHDAQAVARGMDESDFKNWRLGMKKERSGKFAGEEFAERFSSIMMPEVMFKASAIAEQFKTPWGTAIIRLRDIKAVAK